MMKMVKNAIGREVPLHVENFRALTPFAGAVVHTPLIKQEKGNRSLPQLNKIVPTLQDAIRQTGLQDGMTISFHHSFRNGDYVLNMVLDVIAALGVKNLTITPSSLTDAHIPLIKHIQSGVVTKIYTSGMRGELGEKISQGMMETPVLFHSHGGRARALETGDIKVDVAFLGVPSCDMYGNANGYTGPSACGSLGYAMCDAQSAAKVVLITDHLVEYPNIPFSIHQNQVDCIVKVDAIGDPTKISTGAARFTRNPRDLLIAQNAARVIINSGYFEDGFSFQTGSGGASIATTRFLRDEMLRRKITASFALGGISQAIVQLHEEGLVRRMLDVQSFDAEAIRSIGTNRYHQEIDASYYANPLNKGCTVNKLNVVVLSALEVDLNFNVNVLTGFDGVIRGASGGHSDTAIGSDLSIIICPLVRGRIASIVERVQTVITPGESVDVIVTDYGVAINPRRQELVSSLKKCGLPLHSIEALQQKAQSIVGVPQPLEFTDKIVGLIEYRDGTIIDVIHQIKA